MAKLITGYSISARLYDQSAKTGSILFAGVDNTKYEGQLHIPNNIFTSWAINLYFRGTQ